MSFDKTNIPKEFDYNSVIFYQGMNVMEENRRGDTKAYTRCVQGLSDWLVPYHDKHFNEKIEEFVKEKEKKFKEIDAKKGIKAAEREAQYNSVEYDFSRKVFVACMQLIKRGSFLPQRREQEIIDEDTEPVWKAKEVKK